MIEKIELVENINATLLKKMDVLKGGLKVKGFEYVSPQ